MNRAFKRFSDETSIHGFKDLFYSNKIIWSIIWTVILVAAVGMTILQMYQAVDQYINQPMSIATEPATQDRIIYPPIHICCTHFINWLDWKKAFALNFTREEVLVGMSFLYQTFSSNDFNEDEAKKGFREKLKAKNFTKLSKFYLAVAKDFPGYKLSERYKVVQGVVTDDITFVRKDDFGLILCYVISSSGLTALSKTHIKPVFQVGIKLSKDRYIDGSSYYSNEEYRRYLASVFAKVVPNWVIDDDSTFQDVIIPIQLYSDGNSDFGTQIKFEEDWITVPFMISAHVRKSHKNNLCNETAKAIVTNMKEEEKCLANYNRMSCKCQMFFDASLLDEDEIDSVCSYPTAFLKSSSIAKGALITEETEISQCNATIKSVSEKCRNVLPPCEMWKYTPSVQVDKTSDWAKKNGSDIYFIYPTNNILITVEIESQTWIDLIGSIGGVLGIWTGASLLSFLQIFYLLCFADEYTQRKRNVVHDQGQHKQQEEINKSKLHELAVQ